jgi:hypothetical protein
MAFGKPTMVPQGLSKEEYEDLRIEIEKEMLRIQEQAEEKIREISSGKR